MAQSISITFKISIIIVYQNIQLFACSNRRFCAISIVVIIRCNDSILHYLFLKYNVCLIKISIVHMAAFLSPTQNIVDVHISNVHIIRCGIHTIEYYCNIRICCCICIDCTSIHSRYKQIKWIPCLVAHAFDIPRGKCNAYTLAL